MKKTSLLMLLITFVIQPSASWSSDTSTGVLENLDQIKERVRALQSQNSENEQELERAKLLEQLKAEESKAADLKQQKKQLEEDANIPKTWEGIPWTVMHTAWVNNYSLIEATFDPRKSSNSIIKEASKVLAKNSKNFKPAVSQINSSHTSVLKSNPSQWASLGLNEDTETHMNIARFLLDKIWLQEYQGKVGFTL